MNTLAILQNQWFKNPERMREIYVRRARTPEDRAKLNARYLFYRSLTGTRLKSSFGELCNEIVWEEASPMVAGKSSGCFPADVPHIVALVRHFRPEVIVAFGRVAMDGVIKSMPVLAGDSIGFRIMGGPHPAARHATVIRELESIANRLRSLKEGAK